MSIHHTALGLKALTRPERFLEKGKQVPRLAAPVSHKDRIYYSDPKHRGYLLPELWGKCSKANPLFAQQYVQIDPSPLPKKPITFKEFLESK